MVNTFRDTAPARLRGLGVVVKIYVAVAVGTALVLAVLKATAQQFAPQEAWIHAVIVLVFAAVLPMRLRAARRGDRSALRAVGIIAAVLLVANVAVGLIPDLLPTWMRLELIGIAILMAVGVLLVARAASAASTEAGPGRRST